MLQESQRDVIHFSSGQDYLQHPKTETSSCVILDLQLPDMCGLELQGRLREDSNPPVIFVSDTSDIRATVRAMKAGAIEFLTKPLDWKLLASAIVEAFARDRERRTKSAELALLEQSHRLLTPREREVLPLVVGGMLNKQAAAILGITEVTLQVHRGQVMRKMKANSFADLVRMAEKLGIPPPADSELTTESHIAKNMRTIQKGRVSSAVYS